jgi:eukaryotic-like serine/threonine-protein kinase
MVCARADWVERFLAGHLEPEAVREMEAHVEGCEECFLRMAAGAADLPEPDRMSLHQRSTDGSRVARSLGMGSTPASFPYEQANANDLEWARQTIGPYVITGFLGMGGMSVVYRARHQVTGREVAVKTVKMPFVASSLAMLRQEIEFLHEARHPAIVTVLDSDLMADDPWYAMELFEEPTLQEFNRRLRNEGRGDVAPRGAAAEIRPPAAGGRLPEVLRLFARLCDPVAFLHGAGMVHGDIKPSNVILRANQQPVLMDFGLAARTKGTIGRETLDVTGRIRGTLPYIAPEIIRGKLPDARADLYAIGCMLYESIVGEPPFSSRSGTKIIDMHLSVLPTPASARVSGVPSKIDELLARLLAKNPAERFGHASALAASLGSIAESFLSGPQGSPTIVSSNQSTPLFRPPLVGRESELNIILESVHRARTTAAGQMLLLVGESGIGKTFLTAEVAQRALLAGVDVVTSECLPSTHSSAFADAGAAPLQGFRRLFEALRDRCRERGRAEVERIFGDRLALLAEYLPALRHLDRDGDPARGTPPLPASAARERIVQAVIDTLAAYASGHPLLLALDDLQWADDLTLAVLERLDGELLGKLPLVVLGTYRSDEISEPIRKLGGRSTTAVLPLGRLTRDDIGAIVGGMLSMGSAPETLSDYVYQHAEGVPFFAAEYLRGLVAAGALVYRTGAWSLRTSSPDRTQEWLAGTPLTLQELIRSRLERLPKDAFEILRAGAVLGRRFSLSRVGRMIGRPVSELAPHLAAASAAEITHSDGLDELTFLHDKIRETLYAGLSEEQRIVLHLAAARAMEDGDSTPPDHYGQIGHHLRNGGETVRAIDYLEKAGAHALRMAANADSERFFREVFDLEATLPAREPALRRARWHRQRADALQGIGLMAESAASLKQSAALLGRPFPARPPALAAALGREVVQQFRHRLSPRFIRRPPAHESPINEEVVRVFERMHQASFYLGNDGDLVLSTTVSLNASERGGPSPHLTVAYTNAAMMAGVMPIPKLAERYFRLAAATAESAPDLGADSWLMLMEGAYRTWAGERQRAIDCLEGAISLFVEQGFSRRRDEAESARAAVDIFAGFHESALARLDPIDARAHRRRDPQIQFWVAMQRAESFLIRGDHAAALEQIDQVGPLLPSLGRPDRIWSTGLECYLRYQQGQATRARELLAKALALISQGPPVHNYCLDAYDRLAETAIALAVEEPPGRGRRQSIRIARKACSVVDRASRPFPIGRPAAALHRGALQLARGRGSVAAVRARWQKAAATARSLSLPLHELRLHRAIIGTFPDRDPRVDLHRQRAVELVQLLGLGATGADPFARPPPPSGAGVKVERELEASRL